MPRIGLCLLFGTGLLLGAIILTALILKPFLISISVAVTFAVILRPVYLRFLIFTRGYRGIASILTILLAVIVFFVGIVDSE